MKAAFIEQTGDPSVIQYADRPEPDVGPGECLIQVGAVAVNPVDTYIRAGAVPMPIELPYVLGSDVAGTVEAVGSGVTRFRKGDRVWGSNQGFFGRQGTFAERISVHEDWLYETPVTMTDVEAAGGALVGITAHLGLYHHGRLQQDEIVFVHGGSGGVGSSVIQLAKAGGAKVIATAGTEDKRDLCLQRGADLALDYKSDSLADDIASFCEEHSRDPDNPGVNLWYETQRDPNLVLAVNAMSKGARLILMAGRDATPQFPLGTFYTRNMQMLGFAMFNATPDEQRLCSESINGLAELDRWTPLIGEVLPLSEARKAHELQEAATLGQGGELTGKIVLTPGA